MRKRKTSRTTLANRCRLSATCGEYALGLRMTPKELVCAFFFVSCMLPQRHAGRASSNVRVSHCDMMLPQDLEEPAKRKNVVTRGPLPSVWAIARA